MYRSIGSILLVLRNQYCQKTEQSLKNLRISNTSTQDKALEKKLSRNVTFGGEEGGKEEKKNVAFFSWFCECVNTHHIEQRLGYLANWTWSGRSSSDSRLSRRSALSGSVICAGHLHHSSRRILSLSVHMKLDKILIYECNNKTLIINIQKIIIFSVKLKYLWKY